MSRSSLTPMQEILRAIERVAPRPWHYRAEAEREGFILAGVEQALELLYLEGLVGRGPSDPAAGPGVVLTPKGERVAADPDAFARLGTGEPLDATDAGAIVRHDLRRRVSPTLTRLLILANVLVFAWGAYLANGLNVVEAYLRGPLLGIKAAEVERLQAVYHRAGDLTASDVVHGDWWRLLACCFVHGGLIHIGMNMYALNNVGGFVEQVWGRWRYAVIYAVSGWGGSCMAMAMQPQVGVVGASGAICGVFAAAGAWFFLNGKYLPRGMARRGKSQIVTSVLLMVFISLVPGVSGYCHLGGALAGGLAAVALNVARFGGMPLRLLAWPVLVAIPVASYMHLDHARKTSPVWQKAGAGAELSDLKQNYFRPVRQVMRSAIADYVSTVKGLRDTHPDRREEADIRAAVASLDAHLAALDELADKLERSGPYRSEEAAGIRADALAYVRQRAEVWREAKRCLEIGKAWKGRDERAFDEQWQKMQRLREAWERRSER